MPREDPTNIIGDLNTKNTRHNSYSKTQEETQDSENEDQTDQQHNTDDESRPPTPNIADETHPQFPPTPHSGCDQTDINDDIEEFNPNNENDPNTSDNIFREAINFGKETNHLLQENIKTQNKIFNRLEVSKKQDKMDNKYKTILKLIQMIPIFTGERTAKLTENLNVFLRGCRDIHDNLREDEQKIFIKLIGNRFRGDAFFKVNREKFETLADLETFLINHYTPVKSPADIIREIGSLKQLPTENILSFAERLQYLRAIARELLSRKYADQNVELLYSEIEEQTIKTFKSGLFNQNLKIAVMTQNAKTLNELIEFAREIELMQTPQSTFIPSKINIIDASNDQNNLEDMIQRIMRKEMSQIFRRDQNNNNRPSQNFSNYNNSNNNPKFSNNQRQNSVQHCAFCGAPGHTIDICRNLKFSLICQNCNGRGHSRINCSQMQSQPKFNNQQHQQKSFIQNAPTYNQNRFQKPQFNNQNFRNFSSQNQQSNYFNSQNSQPNSFPQRQNNYNSNWQNGNNPQNQKPYENYNQKNQYNQGNNNPKQPFNYEQTNNKNYNNYPNGHTNQNYRQYDRTPKPIEQTQHKNINQTIPNPQINSGNYPGQI